MKHYILPFAIAFMSCESLTQGPRRDLDKKPSEKDILAMKNFGLCLCLNKGIPLTKEQARQDGSVGAYFQLSTINEENIDSLYHYVESYLDTVIVSSSIGATLGIHSCIEMYNSPELDIYVKRQLSKQ